jgi:2-C-methyl-D-erythritol 4-phosphate cytidylyltransferase/2-C-methyl-D-erythritol 2,4-cyclodiphosphate synthase
MAGALFWLVPAAGSGQRLGASKPKQYLPLGAATVLEHTVRACLAVPCKACIVVVQPDDDHLELNRLTGIGAVCVEPVGGPSRRDSVLAGIRALRDRHGAKPNDWVLVHDAARPGLTPTAARRLIAAVASHPVGGYLAQPCTDTVRRVNAHQVLAIDRAELWLAQTPQMMRLDVLEQALLASPHATDEADAVGPWAQQRGLPQPVPVAGERRNFKITTQDDLDMMQTLFSTGSALRIGQGYDVHALVPGRALVLGGVTIEHPTGLLGHSDADALLHAITDAVIGAAGLGDIGHLFPDTDPAHHGADSAKLLQAAMAKALEQGWRLVNVDATVIAQAPKLAPYMPAMRDAVAAALGCPVQCVNLKAKTSERLGFVGRQEGIEAFANVLMQAA